MKKKIIGILIILLVVFCTFNFVTNVQAIGEETVTLTDGASIRETVDHQGLKFSATLSTIEGVTEHGFYVALGEHDTDAMVLAINSSATTVGTNKLVQKTISGDVDLEFNLIIIGFPDTSEAYSNEITVMAYAVISGTKILSITSTTRSIGSVAKIAVDSGNSGTYLDQVYDKYVLFIGFESWAGFESGTYYANTVPREHITDVGNWQILEGNVSTTDQIEPGEQSLQFRDYDSNSVIGSAYMDYSIDDVAYVTFRAKDTSDYDVAVSYSTDGGTNWIGAETFELTTSVATYTYTVASGVGTNDVQLKFDVVAPAVLVDKARVYIDDIQFVTNAE